MLIRHSSEAFSSLLLVLSLGLWHRMERHGAKARLAIAFAAGVVGGLAFDSRYQVGLFLVGFGLTALFSSGSGVALGRWALAVLALGGALSVGTGLALDAWGYGHLTLTPWNYFTSQVLKDIAGQFGSSPWYAYLLAVPIYTLNPFLWFWLVEAARQSWRHPFDRCILGGLALFLAVHFVIPHKEARFLVPMAAPAALLILRMFSRSEPGRGEPAGGKPGPSGLTRWIRPMPYVKAVAAANLVVLVVFSAFGLASGPSRVDPVLWELPPGTTVLSATDLFYYFDEARAEPSFPSGGPYVAKFRKPPGLRYVYSPPDEFGAACTDDPEALVLLTSSQQWSALDRPRPLVDRPFPSLSRFPPSWLASLPLPYQRLWRYKLVTCDDYMGMLDTR